jgi:hypothetical protein
MRSVALGLSSYGNYILDAVKGKVVRDDAARQKVLEKVKTASASS